MKIQLETKNGSETMSLSEFTRWGCLIEGVEKSGDFAERKNIDMERASNWIKPSAFRHYISAMFIRTYHGLYKQLNGFNPTDIPVAYHNDIDADEKN
tara:strand:+ start:49258 stop:49548 length:291 start_codon:yes stop_codon:yes gene_type:complete